MKKSAIILLAIMFFSFSSANLYAQDYKHTVTAGAGFSLVGTVLKALRVASTTGTTTSTSNLDDAGYSSIPALQVSYGFMLSERFSVGVAGSHQYFNIDNTTSDEYIHVKRSNLAIRALIHYGSSDRIDMYSGVRLGATMWNTDFKINGTEDDPTVKQVNDEIKKRLSGTKFAPQLIAFGLRGYFTDNIGAFAELAIGPPAYLSAGVNFRF